MPTALRVASSVPESAGAHIHTLRVSLPRARDEGEGCAGRQNGARMGPNAAGKAWGGRLWPEPGLGPPLPPLTNNPSR